MSAMSSTTAGTTVYLFLGAIASVGCHPLQIREYPTSYLAKPRLATAVELLNASLLIEKKLSDVRRLVPFSLSVIFASLAISSCFLLEPAANLHVSSGRVRWREQR